MVISIYISSICLQS